MRFRCCFAVFVLSLFLTAIGQPQTWSAGRPDGSEIVYYLDLPRQKPYPLIALLQGSECLRVADKYRDFVREMNARGVAVLRVEKPGLTADTPIGECPPEYLRKNSWDRRVLDLLIVLGQIRREPNGWNGRLGLAGGSEGAMIAAMTAPLVPETEAVLLFSGGGVLNFGQEVKLGIAHQMRVGGASESDIEQQADTIERQWAEVVDNPSHQQEWGSDGELARNTYLWWANAIPIALHRPLLQVTDPIRVYQGSRDDQVRPELSQGLSRLFHQANRTNLELVMYDGEHVPSAEVITEGLNWLAEKLSPPGP